MSRRKARAGQLRAIGQRTDRSAARAGERTSAPLLPIVASVVGSAGDKWGQPTDETVRRSRSFPARPRASWANNDGRDKRRPSGRRRRQVGAIYKADCLGKTDRRGRA